jgi:uncharacterized membrane protein YqjE
MAATDYDQLSIPELGRRLADTAKDLANKHVLLAKQEAREDLRIGLQAAIWLGVGAALLLFALICFLVALTAGTARLIAWVIGGSDLLWLAAIIWLVVFLAIGAGCLFVGRRRLQFQPFGRTRGILKEDEEWARQRLKLPEK